MQKTIYIITNEDKVLLKAFTDKKNAITELENNYSNIDGSYYLEPCSLEIDKKFIEKLKS